MVLKKLELEESKARDRVRKPDLTLGSIANGLGTDDRSQTF